MKGGLMIKKSFFKIFIIGMAVLFLFPQGSPANDKDVLEGYWHGHYGKASSTGKIRILWDLLAKAKVDECYYGLQDPRNRPSFNATFPNDFTTDQVNACISENGKPKVNQAYVWGLTKYGDNVWFGTVANTLCLVLNGFYGPMTPSAMENTSWTCEMNYKDVRPPRIFMYNTKTQQLTDKTQSVLDKGTTDSVRLMSTTGLRSAGSHNNVVFLGGIASGGVSMFAFNAETGEYLGSTLLNQYNNIRQWRVINNELYTGVGKRSGGEILRWTGSITDPFQFENVGDLTGDPAYLVEHDGRIFASTWGGPDDSGGTVLYMSPLFGEDKILTADDKTCWKIMWKLSDYEVEPAAFQVGGALESYEGYLYWGTMHVPGTGLVAFSEMYPGAEAGAAAFLGTYRPIVIFRGKKFDTPKQRIELLYGTSRLPKYDAANAKWTIVPNNMHQKPKYGLAGINNFFNNYTWSMQVYKNQLFVGTMDWLYLGGVIVESLGIDIPDNLQALIREKFDGADLRCFPSGDRPAVAVSLNGLDNYLNYGIRTMVADDDCLYIGTANPMNLATDPKKPDGGWELFRLYDKKTAKKLKR